MEAGDELDYVIVGLVFGMICAVVALARNRNPAGWFLVGGALPLLGLILICLVPAVPAVIDHRHS